MRLTESFLRLFACACVHKSVLVSPACVFVSHLFDVDATSLFLRVFAGILPAVRRGHLLPAGSSAGRAGALEVRAGMRERVFGVRVCRDSCGPRARREDQCERPPCRDRGGFSWGQRRHVQLPERQLEAGLHIRHSLPAQRLLPPQLCPGSKHALGSDFKPLTAGVCKGFTAGSEMCLQYVEKFELLQQILDKLHCSIKPEANWWMEYSLYIFFLK